MDDNTPVYNSRITKTYINYLKKNYPDLDINRVLDYAQMTRYEVNDPGHWFSQNQTDRFQEIVVKLTGNQNIAREAGRFTASTEGLGAAKQRVLGFVGPTTVYLLMEKIYPILSRGADVTAKRRGYGQIEIVSTPKSGLKEKQYQCENRYGSLEAMARLFTDRFATISHPDCFHKGDNCCRYLITWKKNPFLIRKQIQNYTLSISTLVCLVFLFIIPFKSWAYLVLIITLINTGYMLYTENLAKRDLTNTIKAQGDAANDLLDELNTRNSNSLLVQEVGQATSKILNIDKLIEAVISIMVKRLEFDRGLIMLANKDETRLAYKAGYGYTKEQEALLKQTEFHLDKSSSRGVFVVAYKEKKPILVDDISKNAATLSKRSLEMAQQMGVQSLICVPIVYENKSLGILAVDNMKTKKPHTQSDVNLLMGVASQTAVGITNAMSFEKLQESEKKYRELVENANSIIMRRDIHGKTTFFNEFAQKFFGYNEKEILGENVFGTILPDTTAARRKIEKLVKALQGDPERQITSENENLLRNGNKVWVAWTYKPILDSEGQIREILCIGNDITELKRAEKEKRDLEIRLQRAQKMEAIGTLAGGVAHDLNNILSGLVSYPELLLMDIPPESPLRKPILTIQKSGERAASIVQDLLTLARRGVSVAEVVNLNEVVSGYLNSPEQEKLELNHPHVQVVSRLETKLLNITGSPVHLSKAIMNLVYNAAEAMPNGGKIFLYTENRYVDKAVTGFENIEEGDYVTLKISDSGIGISEKDLERIFEPFYSKKVMGKSGTGLGMAVIWGTVKDHKGYIDVQSTEGKGTTFTLYFPVTRKMSTGKEYSATIEELMGNGEKVLVVDDVKEQRNIATEMLNKLGYAVSSASSGEEALDYLKTNASDLVVLDMIMDPGMDGLDTYKKIIKLHPGQKAIIVSGFSESARVKSLQKLGAGAYIKKPYLMEEIGLAIKSELSQRE